MPWHPDSRGRAVPRSLQQRCFKRDHWTCVDCGYVGRQTPGDLNADHVIPSAEGGDTILENLATRCTIPTPGAPTGCHGLKTQQEAARGRARLRPKRKPPMHPADALSNHPQRVPANTGQPGWRQRHSCRSDGQVTMSNNEL